MLAKNRVNNIFRKMVKTNIKTETEPNLNNPINIHTTERLNAISVRYEETWAFLARFNVFPLIGRGWMMTFSEVSNNMVVNSEIIDMAIIAIRKMWAK
jgi:hypothetical protein